MAPSRDTARLRNPLGNMLLEDPLLEGFSGPPGPGVDCPASATFSSARVESIAVAPCAIGIPDHAWA